VLNNAGGQVCPILSRKPTDRPVSHKISWFIPESGIFQQYSPLGPNAALRAKVVAHGPRRYPPDRQGIAAKIVLQQAEALA
jgi:hypothetical protein